MEEQSTVPVVDGCTNCQHVAEHLRSIGVEVATRPVDASPPTLLGDDPSNGDLWSGFRSDLVSEYEEVR